MSLSIVICTRDRPSMVRLVLGSLAPLPAVFDVHVVDQSTDRSTIEVVEELATDFGPDRLHVHHQALAGAARARNRGYRESKGELVAFLDDDVTVHRDWLDVALSVFADPAAALAYGQVLVPEALTDEVSRGKIVPSLVWSDRNVLRRPAPFRLWGMSANMVVRRSALDRIGGFDETLGVGGVCRAGEDFDFSYRIWTTGLAIVNEPALRVDHYGMRSEDQWPTTLANYGFGDGAFFMKHLRCGDPAIVPVLLRHVALLAARNAKDCLRKRRRVPNVYLDNLWKGMRFSRGMGIDPTRKYVWSGAAVSTDANPISTR
ncbi:MAG: glycosyltransferase family 2 protein [Armatimonadota bacterium]